MTEQAQKPTTPEQASPPTLGLQSLSWTLGLILFYSIGCTWLSLERLRLGRADWAFDIAFFHDLIASASRGEGFSQSASTHEWDGLLQLSHAFFLLPAYVPAYAMRPGLSTLVFIQCLTLGLMLLVLFRLSQALRISSSIYVLMSLLVLTCPPLIRFGLADFNPLLAGLPLLLGLGTALLTRRLVPALVLALLACLVREELPIMVIGLSLSLSLFGSSRPRHALSVCLLAGVCFLASSYLRPRSTFYIPFNSLNALWELLQSPSSDGIPASRKLEHLVSFVSPGLLPTLLSPATVLASVPLLMYQLGMSRYEWWHWSGPYVHHCAPLLAFAILGLPLGIRRMEQFLVPRTRFAQHILIGILGVGLFCQLPSSLAAVQEPMGWLDPPSEQAARAEKAAAVATLLAQIPNDAPVAADYVWMAQLSGRKTLYSYQSSFEVQSHKDEQGRLLPGLDLVSYVLLDGSDEAPHLKWRQRLEATEEFKLKAEAGGYRLYQRQARPVAPTERTPAP